MSQMYIVGHYLRTNASPSMPGRFSLMPLMPEIIPKYQLPFGYRLLTNDAPGRINPPIMWRAKSEATIATS